MMEQASCSCRHQRQRLRHQVQVRQPLWLPRSLADGIKRATDVMVAGKVACVCGYGDGRQGLFPLIARIRRARDCQPRLIPSNALQAAMEGFEVKTVEDTLGEADIYVTTTATATSSRSNTWRR